MTPDPRWVRLSRLSLLGMLGLWMAQSLLLTTVGAGMVGVRYNNALGLHKEDLQPGLHLELLGVHRVWRLPSHYLILDYTEDRALSIRTKDNNTVVVDISIPYRIKRGEAWKVMDAGNHASDGNGVYRFQRFAEETATSVLREKIAQLPSEDFYNTARRLAVAASTLKALNEKLAAYHLEASTVLVRATFFRDEYETQLATIQFNEQQKLLDGAKRVVAEQRQELDNFEQQSAALAAAKEQSWVGRIAELDRAYQVGFMDTGDDQTPGAARRLMEALSEEQRAQYVTRAATVFGVGEERITDGHLLGIKNVDAESVEYSLRVVAQADAISSRLEAEGVARIAKLQGAYEARINQLLGSPAGRAYVAYNVAEKIKFADDLLFQSSDGIPSVLRLGEFARQLMGR